MSLANSLLVGGVHVAVRLDTSRLRDDFARMKREAEQYARDGVRVGAPGGGTGGGSPGRLSGLGISGLGASLGGLGQAASTLKAIQAQHGRYLAEIAKNTAMSGAQAKYSLRAFDDARRMEVQGRAGAALRGRINQLLGTNLSTNASRFGHLGADIRAAGGGYGFGGGGSASASPAAAVTQSAGHLSQAAGSVTQAAQALNQAGAAARRRAPAGGVMAGVPGQAPKFYPGGRFIPGDAMIVPGQAPGTTSGNFRRGSRRSGSSDYAAMAGSGLMGVGRRLGAGGIAGLGLVGGASAFGAGNLASGAGGILSGAAGMAPGALGGLMSMLGSVPPAAAAAGAAVLGFGNTLDLLKAPGRAAGNLVRSVEENYHRLAMSPLLRAGRNVLAAPFHVALAPLRLFSGGVDDSVRRYGALGTVARGSGAAIVAPFRLAASPLAAFVTGLQRASALASVLAPALAAAFAGRSIHAASEAEQTVNRLNTALGESSPRAQRFADTMASRFGQARTQIMETQAQLALMMTGAGVGQGRAAGMSEDMTRRAVDMAAVFTRPIEDIKGAMQSALAGNFQSMRQFDTLLTAQAVKEEAVRRGFAATTSEVSEQARVMATYSLLMQKTSQFQGGLNANMNTFGNLVREVRGRVENAAGSLGATLLPAAREAMLAITDLFNVGGGEGGPPVLGFFTAVGERIRGWIRSIRVVINNFGLFTEAAKLSAEGVGSAFGNAFNWLMEAGRRVTDWFGENWRNMLLDMGNAFQAMTANLGTNLKNLFQATKDFVAGKGWDFQSVGLLSGFTATTAALPEMPAFESGLAGMRQRITELLMPAFQGALRGDESAPGMQRHAAGHAGLMGEDDDSSRGRRSGQFISARQLVELQNQSSADQERRRVARQTAENTRAAREYLKTIAENLSGGALTSVTAVAAP